ncbi:MAG: Asp-tRNA(Asn)/Glu-tRNA(Gln) amidotransferase GatCAB subunit C, partial [Sulfurospirillum sp.]
SFSTLDGGTPLREDKPRQANDVAENILKHAPKSADDFFIVPAIID